MAKNTLRNIARTKAKVNTVRRLSRRKRGKGGGWLIVIIIAVIAAGLFAVNHFGWDSITEFLGLNEAPAVSAPTEGTVQVHFIDVGQGDCALILTPEKAVLIDSGDTQFAERVIDYIRRMGIDKLDLIIVSHPHADHIGGMDKIISAINTDKLIMPKLPDNLIPTTGVYFAMLEAIEEHSVERAYAQPGEVINLGNAFIEILAPHNDSEFSEINDYSVVAKLVHGGNSFLFTGDMQRAAENDVLERGVDLSADVLKIAHHGSRTSSQRAFLEAVKTQSDSAGRFAVISVASPNQHNHPNNDVIRLLEALDYEIKRTDESGTIIFISSSEGLEVVS
jgi:competence protein ComEC